MGKEKKRWEKKVVLSHPSSPPSSTLSLPFSYFDIWKRWKGLKTLNWGGGCFLGASASSQELVSLRQIFARAPWNWPGKRRKKCCLQKNKAETRRIQVKTLSGLTVLRSLHQFLPLAWGLEFRLGDGFSPFREDELQVACLVGLPAGNEPKNQTTDTGHTHTHRNTRIDMCL